MSTDIDLDALRTQTDPLIANLAGAVEQVKGHDHPAKGGDLYCLNLTSYMGDRMATVLRRLAAEQAEVDRMRNEWDRLVNEIAAMLGVVRAATAWRATDDEAPGFVEIENALVDAVDALPGEVA